MTTIATLLSGGECVGVGARQAGLTHLWGIEYDDDIANVARMNGFEVITADVMSVDPHSLPVPDVLHASTVCKRASGANQSAELNEDGTKEAPEDIAMGEKVAQFIDVMQPRIFTLENVYAYRNFRAFKTICAALNRGGYMWDFDNLNAADYGVPQTRRRLILRAKRGALLPNLPQPVRWVGWYEAIEDLIPGLPESQFAAWQLARLPEEIKGNLMSVINGEASDYILANEPIQTIASNHSSNKYRAFILDCQKAGDTNGDRLVTLPQGNEPMFTVTSGKNGKQPVRAFIVGTNANDSSGAKIYQEADEPVQAIRTPGGGRELRAWLIGSENAGQEWGGTKWDIEPAMTITQEQKPRAWLSQGRVVKMTPRALARFQSIPDDYGLTGNNKLDCTVIGNGVPPKLYQSIVEGLAE